MIIQDEQLNARGNNFTLVRLILASSVIYTHCYGLVFGAEGQDDLSFILGAPISALAVDGFFFLSGFLVYPSLLRLGSARGFLMARFTRLWPGLALCILLTVLGGLAVTSAPGLSYFGEDTARFIGGNLTFLFGAYSLTGVNCDGGPCNINGSLWTLPWEVRCYLLLAVLGLTGLARPQIMKWVILPATLVGALVWDIDAVQDLAVALLGEGKVYLIGVFDRLWPLFALGIAAFLFRDRLRLSWWVLGALFLLNIAAHRVGVGLHVRALFVGYAVLCMGLLTARKGAISGAWPDYSYGMYIYAFPVMVMISALWGTSSHVALALANFVMTLPLAALSWHVVEKPALDAYRSRRHARAITPAALGSGPG
jgi:peptidoglycan/LPS O-acetylase OafA/YrhL